MLTVNPFKRITAAEALKHPWICVSAWWFERAFANVQRSNPLLSSHFSNENVSRLWFIGKKQWTASKNSTHVVSLR
jgi:serine/threonine protein kinase